MMMIGAHKLHWHLVIMTTFCQIGLLNADQVNGQVLETSSQTQKDAARQDSTPDVRRRPAGLIEIIQESVKGEPSRIIRKEILEQDLEFNVDADQTLQGVPFVQRGRRPENQEVKILEHLHLHLDKVANAADRLGQAKQVIIEMKKGRGTQSKSAFGVFADASWIEMKDDLLQVQLDARISDRSQPKRYWIGVRCVELSAVDREELGVDLLNSNEESASRLKPRGKQVGLVVQDVVPQSAASEAGIKQRDVLVSMNSIRLQRISDLVSEVQRNQSSVAKLKVIRSGRPLDVSVRPEMKPPAKQHAVRTIFASATEAGRAVRKIESLKQMMRDRKIAQQEYRLVLVGPGVNFGQQEVELRFGNANTPDVTALIDDVAKQKFGVLFDENRVELNSAANSLPAVEAFPIAPQQIWNSIEVGANGKSISIARLTPTMMPNNKASVKVRVQRVNNIEPFEVGRGQFVFRQPLQVVSSLKDFTLKLDNETPNTPWSEIRSAAKEMKLVAKVLQKQNEAMRTENQLLKNELKKVRAELERMRKLERALKPDAKKLGKTKPEK